MDILTIALESVILCAVFTAAVVAGSKNPIDTVYDMPEPIVNRCLELGLIDDTKKRSSPQTKAKKLLAGVITGLILALVLIFVNHAENFLQGAAISYIIWFVIDWYDCFVIDWIWICHSKKIIIPGTEDLTKSYKDYKFHAVGSLKGMLYGIPIAVLVGALVQILNIFL